jgi:hypothetical protein
MADQIKLSKQHKKRERRKPMGFMDNVR